MDPARRKIQYRLMPEDREYLKQFRLNPVLQSVQLHRLVPRGSDTQVTRHRLRALQHHGLIQSSWPSEQTKFSVGRNHQIHYPTPKGWKAIFENGFLPEPVGMGETRTDHNADHDLRLADLYIAMREQFAKVGYAIKRWERLPKFLKVPDFVNPDVFMVFGNEKWESAGYIEWEQKQESKFVRDPETGLPKSDLIKMLQRYQRYYESGLHAERTGFEPLRVYVFRPTWEIAVNLCERLRKFAELAPQTYGFLGTKRWFITSADRVRNLTEKIFITPADYDRTSYSFED